MTLDISQDYLLFDNTETVSLTRLVAGDATTIENAKATLPPAKVAQQAFGNFQLEAKDKVLSLFVDQVGTDDINPSRDYVTDADGIDWIVQAATLQTIKTRWLIVARQRGK